MGEVESIRRANAAYAAVFRRDGMGPRPRRQLAVVACMDARLDLFAMLGLQPGDAHIIRNGGGIVTEDVIRSLCLSQRNLGTREIVLVHHTDCGLEGLDDARLADELEQETGIRPDWEAGGFADPFEDVRRSARRIGQSPFIPFPQNLSGFVFDVDTGRLLDVDLTRGSGG